MSELRTLRALFLVEHLNLEAATGFEGARWEHFQLAHLNDDSTFRIENKARQIAWSWLSAAEAVAEAVLPPYTSSFFVSINQDEAKEKLRYARQIMEALEYVKLPSLTRDNEMEIELSNGARLISLPARPPRGKARFNVYLDEFAHVQKDRLIYQAALPVISKGGRLRIGSSPLGASGTFWEVYSETLQRYPGYTRKRTPWWEIQAFCTNVREARKLAPALTTAQRVEVFGNDRIRAIYVNMPEEDFRQEYEAEFVDETTAWITWEEIRAIQREDLLCELVSSCSGNINEALRAVERVAGLVRDGKIEQVLAAGVDIGRTRNTTEIYVIGVSTTSNYPLRLAITLDGCEFDDQEAVIGAVLRQLPIRSMLIDQNGIGMNLTENLVKAFPAKVQAATFTNPNKGLWATNAKMLTQQRKPIIPSDRDLAYQIHSIKKTVTASKNLVFDTARNERHHADKFWAWVLGLEAANQQGVGLVQRANPLSGYRG